MLLWDRVGVNGAAPLGHVNQIGFGVNGTAFLGHVALALSWIGPRVNGTAPWDMSLCRRGIRSDRGQDMLLYCKGIRLDWRWELLCCSGIRSDWGRS